MTKKRCAIYARTSSEEGLAQDFNSLHAQAEACEAYVRSQVGEGWRVVGKVFQDGGYSGGTMERPALAALLAEVDAGRIDVIVVYKVDRLTRSLADFAKIVERLDAAKASFVAVTQSFNTTTSMGRLTLNVLLSFAQFEREVTAERIRDKFAASKARGLWMGGTLPLGYDVKDRALVINGGEAETVRRIYSRFLVLKSIPALASELARDGVKSKQWISSRGRHRGGASIGRGALYHMLGNHVYRGMIAHKGKVHPGQHEAIIDEPLWEAVQSVRAHNKAATRERLESGALLQGKLFDAAGALMSPSHTRKGARRYHYYVSAPLIRGTEAPSPDRLQRISAPVLEGAVLAEVAPLLCPSTLGEGNERRRLRDALMRVVIANTQMTIVLRSAAVALEHRPNIRVDGDEFSFECSIAFRRPRNATTLLHSARDTNPRVDRMLVRAVAQAHRWAKQLESGAYASVSALARAERLCLNRTNALLPLAYLAPDLVALIVDGRQPRTLTVATLTDAPLPLDWPGQRARFAAAL